MHAYDEMYLEYSKEKLGLMLSYAVNGLGMPLRAFYDRFLVSPEARMFAIGHPKYVAGMSGIELALSVLDREEDNTGIGREVDDIYWTGWALAQLQWYSGLDFAQIDQAFPIEEILRLYYPLHEADITRFIAVAERRLQALKTESISPIKLLRKTHGLTQQALAKRSGVSLRMIRAYEQGSKDLSRAEADTLIRLSHALHCPAERLLQK